MNEWIKSFIFVKITQNYCTCCKANQLMGGVTVSNDVTIYYMCQAPIGQPSSWDSDSVAYYLNAAAMYPNFTLRIKNKKKNTLQQARERHTHESIAIDELTRDKGAWMRVFQLCAGVVLPHFELSGCFFLKPNTQYMRIGHRHNYLTY